jgi:hypothetical protein
MFIYAEPMTLTKVLRTKELRLILVKSRVFRVVMACSSLEVHKNLGKYITSSFGINE